MNLHRKWRFVICGQKLFFDKKGSYQSGGKYSAFEGGIICFSAPDGEWVVTVLENSRDPQECKQALFDFGDQIPEWIKTNAGWWARGEIDDKAFVSGIQYLIEQGIMKIPYTIVLESAGNEIPGWVKANAGWWASGDIDNKTFVSGILYLIKHGIIVLDFSSQNEDEKDEPKNCKTESGAEDGKCFVDAFENCQPAIISTSFYTREGDPIISSAEIIFWQDSCLVNKKIDTTQDRFGYPQIINEICKDPKLLDDNFLSLECERGEGGFYLYKIRDEIARVEKENCEKAGGLWGFWITIPPYNDSCNLPTSDGGKECTDSAQCESWCKAPENAEVGTQATGTCYGFQDTLCMQSISNGTVNHEWCK